MRLHPNKTTVAEQRERENFKADIAKKTRLQHLHRYDGECGTP